jgi:Flp pilus assembly pilin Flp
VQFIKNFLVDETGGLMEYILIAAAMVGLGFAGYSLVKEPVANAFRQSGTFLEQGLQGRTSGQGGQSQPQQGVQNPPSPQIPQDQSPPSPQGDPDSGPVGPFSAHEVQRIRQDTGIDRQRLATMLSQGWRFVNRGGHYTALPPIN